MLIVAIVGVFTPLTCVVGALVGAAVQWLMPETTADVLKAAGITLPLWKVGAALAFVGSFLRSNVTPQKT